nr:hypothetical protein [Tanacetum cinerariifolium]
MKEKEVQAIEEIEKRLQESEMHKQESLVNEVTTLKVNLCIDGITLDASLVIEGTTLEACLVTEGAALEACLVNDCITLNDNMGVTESSGTKSANSSLENLFRSSVDENKSSIKESNSSKWNDADVDIGSSNDSNTILGVYHDLFKNMFAHEIQNNKKT